MFASPVLSVSIHAPVMDANLVNSYAVVRACFNPRARDGRELSFVVLPVVQPVSIHAPVMDANVSVLSGKRPYMFQSTRP